MMKQKKYDCAVDLKMGVNQGSKLILNKFLKQRAIKSYHSQILIFVLIAVVLGLFSFTYRKLFSKVEHLH